MTHPELALGRILECSSTLGPERAPLKESLGRVLAADVAATGDWPPFDYSPGYGYAILTGDVQSACPEVPARLEMSSGLIGEGADGPRRFPGRAVPVGPGTPLPLSAEAVVAEEEVELEDGALRVVSPVSPGARIRPRGLDIVRGELLLSRGGAIRPPDLALLAAQGYEAVSVVRRARVAVAVAPAGGKGAVSAADRCSAPALAAALAALGAAVDDRGVLPEGEGRLREALGAAAASSDALVLAGGLAESCREGAAAALLSLGFRPDFWGVAIEPGSGLFFGRLKGMLVFGLPGPVAAALLCLDEFVRPAVDALHGRERMATEYPLSAALEGHALKDGARQLYLFGEARRGPEGFRFRPLAFPRQGLARGANAIARVPIGPSRLASGSEVAFRWL